MDNDQKPYILGLAADGLCSVICLEHFVARGLKREEAEALVNALNAEKVK